MDKIKGYLQQNKLAQAILICVYVLTTSLSLYLLQESVVAFLLVLFSLYLLYLTHFKNSIKWISAIFILTILIPYVSSQGTAFQSYMDVSTLVGIYVAMALGLNIVVGLAGLLDLGFIAFFAIGAYTYAIFSTNQVTNFIHTNFFPLTGNSFWLFIFIGGFVAAISGILLGIPVLRVKGDYLAIVTLGFGEIIRIVFNNLDRPINFTNGAKGISGIPSPTIFGYVLSDSNQFYYVVLALLGIVILAVTRLENSKLGRSWKAVRENEIAAQSMGIHLVRTKLLAFAIGASFSGMMGVVFSAKQMFIDPTSFTMLQSITILVMVILGGMGSVPGVILGAALVTILNLQVLTEVTNYLNQLTLDGVISIPTALSPAKMQRFIFGMVLILVAIFRPQGLLPAKNKKVNKEDLIETHTEEHKQTISM
ncbi:branched-chain amino acid ABC transporter permease [Bacillus sp. RG28]|uniref:Branched-chain amino acid ABC transporter permease n=1 Tax=Gottfriedia endophytica TaxID=2820819 RepID=A0A940SKD3_9BACI|nr:branched-chain amino acid ABC transporter permease [Gottfriedia endophytica]MBP0725899.1 branched-chain amino acid ABC transporter permease [Gottfriedia endophytica]